MNKRLLLAFALLSTTSAGAQVRFSAGPQVGYTLASANYKFGNAIATYDNRYRSGFSGGLTAELGMGHLLARPAVLYAQKGYNQMYNGSGFGKTASSASRTRIDYLTVPLNIGYAQHADGQGIQVFAGAYFGFALGGHYHSDWEYSSLNVSGTQYESYDGRVVADGNETKGTDLPVRSTDFGVQGGIGYRYQHLLAQLEYSVGLRNVQPQAVTVNPLPTYHNRVFQLSLAYLFGPKS